MLLLLLFFVVGYDMNAFVSENLELQNRLSWVVIGFHLNFLKWSPKPWVSI